MVEPLHDVGNIVSGARDTRVSMAEGRMRSSMSPARKRKKKRYKLLKNILDKYKKNTL